MAAVAAALKGPRYEVVPVAGIDEQVAEVPKDVKLTVTVSPRKGLDATLECSERLAKMGFAAVPHVAARLIRDRAHLKELLQRLRDAGHREIFVVAGDVDEPVGEFAGGDSLLSAMAEVGHDLEEIGITGYPESHPFIDDDVTIQAMWDKRRFATYIVSQICFRPKVIGEWVRRVRRRGVHLPLHIGMAGVVGVQKLLRISAKIGLGESARFLGRHRNWFLRLAVPGGYNPDRLMRGMAPYIAQADNDIRGLHIYTFNEVGETERWRRARLSAWGAGYERRVT